MSSRASSGRPRWIIWRLMLERMYEPSGLSPASLAACRASTKYFWAVGWRPTSYDIQPASSASSAATLNSLRVVASGWGSWSRSVTSCNWPTTALRRRPPPHWASHWRNMRVVDSSSSSSGRDSRPGLRASRADWGSGGTGEAGVGTSQRCMGSMREGPADSASEVPRKPRRASIRSLRENSPSRATVCGPVQGRSTPEAAGDWRAARRPRSSMETTQPKRSENSSERMRGIGSRGFSPSSQRRTREVSVEMWLAPNWRALRFTWRASSPLDQPLRTNHEPSSSLGRLSACVPLPPLPPTGTPPSLRPLVARCAKPYQNAGKYGLPSAGSHPSNGLTTCLRHTHECMCPGDSHTHSNPTITRPTTGIPETPPFATPSNELTVARTRFT